MSSAGRSKAVLRTYPNWFYLPAAIVFILFFLVPTAMAFYYSLTRWTLFDATFIGFDNYITFLKDPSLKSGLINTIIYAVLTSGLKTIISLPLAMLLTSRIRFKELYQCSFMSKQRSRCPGPGRKNHRPVVPRSE